MIIICSCNKNKVSKFKVQMANGNTAEVKSEQEARALVRINGGSYAPVK